MTVSIKVIDDTETIAEADRLVDNIAANEPPTVVGAVLIAATTFLAYENPGSVPELLAMVAHGIARAQTANRLGLQRPVASENDNTLGLCRQGATPCGNA